MMENQPTPAALVTTHPAQRRAPALERLHGVVRLAVRADGPTTRLMENYQAGGAKAQFPRHRHCAPLEAVLVNTAGGLTGGDRLGVSVTAGADAEVIVTTQAAERVYRRLVGVTEIETNLSVASRASLDWLPQETIVFDRSALKRTLTADVDPAGRLLAVEAIVFGRAAMGESAKNIVISDTWRIRRGDTLVFADGLSLDGDATTIMAGGATGSGAAAVATLVLVAPDAEARIDSARKMLAACAGDAGASAWNGMLVARLSAPSGHVLRADLIGLIECLRGAPMPRVWTC